MFIINLRYPCIQIKELNGYITHRKWSWFHSAKGTKHLIGSSAFYTLGGANTARIGALTKIVKNAYMLRTNSSFYQSCKIELSKYKL